jgi:transposase
VGHQPQILSFGQKKTQHVLGGVRVPQGDFFSRFAEVCNGASFKTFLGGLMFSYYPQKIFLVLDNARYHKEPSVASFCQGHSRQLELWFLPTYSPDLNAAEPIWGYTRREATHNRYFLQKEEMIATVKKTFRDIQKHPEKIQNLLAAYN